MAGYRYHLKRYFEISKEEWSSLFITAAVIGFVVTYNDWGGETFDLMVGLVNLSKGLLAAGFALWLHVAVLKATGVYYGVRATYEKYGLGLLIGVFVTFLTFGLWPLWVNGHHRFLAIPNLRVGKFRATIAKDWELGLVSAAAVLASLFVTIPLALLYNATGFSLFWVMVKVSLLIAIYAMIPLPLIQTNNPYQMYMSRTEMLEGNLSGFDIFWGSRAYYFMLLAIVLGFSVFMLLFGPTLWTILLSFLLGFAGLGLWIVIRDMEKY